MERSIVYLLCILLLQELSLAGPRGSLQTKYVTGVTPRVRACLFSLEASLI